jgi:hypothetical protein
MRVRTLLVVVAAALVLCAPAAFAQNLLTNGSFESGDFAPGWTCGGNCEFTQVVSGPFYVYNGAQDGQFYVTGGAVGSPATISQTFSDVAGGSYSLSFWMNSVGDDPSFFSVSINGNTLLSQSDPSTGGNWTEFTFNFTGSGTDTVTFQIQDDPEYIALDNVSVTENGGGTVPEPSSFMLMGSGVLGLAGVIRRKLQ